MYKLHKRRIDLKSGDYDTFLATLNLASTKLKNTDFSMQDKLDELIEIFKEAKIIELSAKKSLAADRATATRVKIAKKKIENAINLLRLEGQKLSTYNVAKTAGVSYNTVKKYVTLNEMKQEANEKLTKID